MSGRKGTPQEQGRAHDQRQDKARNGRNAGADKGDPGRKPVNQGILRLLRRVEIDRGLLLRIIGLVLLINAAELLQPLILGRVIDDCLKQGGMEQFPLLLALGLGYLSCTLAGPLLQVMQARMVAVLGQTALQRLRGEVHRHIMNLPVRLLHRYSTGRLITLATNDVETLDEFFSDVLAQLFHDVLLLVGIVGVMLCLDWRLALIAFTTLPLIGWIAVAVRRKLHANFVRIKGYIGHINAFFAENISGMRLIQLFTRERLRMQAFDELNEGLNVCYHTQIRLNSLLRPLMELIGTLGTVILIWTATDGIASGSLRIGVLVAFATYIKQFFEPINDLAEKYVSIQSASVSSDRILELLDQHEELEDLQAGDAVGEVAGRIEFRNVWFSYEAGNAENGSRPKEAGNAGSSSHLKKAGTGGSVRSSETAGTGDSGDASCDWVLRDVSFVMEAGKSTAVVGATGAGKTTLIQLMLRFYDPQRGAILLDGRDISTLKKQDLRRVMAIVLQEVFLFTGTVWDNIRLGDDSIDDDQVEEALRIAQADSFVGQHGDPRATPIPERGSSFSAGQRQLLSFARAIARQPAVFILDEATANIDSATEGLVREAIARVSENRTTIIVAHRLSTIRQCDCILVMEDGRVAEQGRHEDLLNQGGIYARLVAAAEEIQGDDAAPAGNTQKQSTQSKNDPPKTGILQRDAQVLHPV